MKRPVIIVLITLIACLISSCTHRGTTRRAIAPDPMAPVAPQAASLVAGNDPQSAARMLVEWLAATPASERDFAMEFTREVYRIYTVSADSGVLESFASTLELAKDSLSLDKQVNVFVAVSTPANLGQMLRNDPEADTIAALVIARYGTDSASVESFLKAFNSN